MALKDKQGEAPDITRQHSRALAFFTDRVQLIRLFVRYLNSDPTPERILFFHGEGGNGKSLLVRYLREYCCKRLSHNTWAWMEAADDRTFQDRLMKAESTEAVATAMLDFGMQPVGENRPQEAFSALLMLRRQLGQAGFRFPLFDFACVWYLRETGQLTDDRLKALLPSEEFDLAKEIVDVPGKLKYVALASAVLRLLGKHLKERFTLYRQKRGIAEEDIVAITALDPVKELPLELPELFAKDLNAGLGSPGTPSRVVLFFDTYEAFWGHERDLAGTAPGFELDEWVRSLLKSLDLGRGIITLVAGRDVPRWAEASRERIEAGDVDLRHIEYLSASDALEYLGQVRASHGGGEFRIPEGPLRERLVAYASAGSDGVHPYYLGLCAEVVLAAAVQGTTLTPEDFGVWMEKSRKGAELTHRLLKYVDSELESAIVALSACRAFDGELYLHLGEALRFQATEARWHALTSFSFVLPAGRRGEGWYRIHALLRGVLEREKEEGVRKAGQALETEYRRQADEGEETARAEAIYHANRINPEQAVDEWVAIFDEALLLSRYRLCSALLDVRTELFVPTPVQKALVARSAGAYWAALAQYSTAVEQFLLAVSAFESALQVAPNDPEILNEMGVVLGRLGSIQAHVAQQEPALQTYERGIACLNAALNIVPTYIAALINKGNILQLLGELRARVSQHELALRSYDQAVTAFDMALQLAPGHISALNGMVLASRLVGELHAQHARNEQAVDNYNRAIATGSEGLRVDPTNVSLLNNVANAFQMLGNLKVEMSAYDDALTCYAQAIDRLDAALVLAPNDISAFNNEGNILGSLADLQIRLARYDAALNTCKRAVASFDAALELAPTYLSALVNKGIVLGSLGDVLTILRHHDRAVEAYKLAINSYKSCLELAPTHLAALNNKGTVLAKLGTLQTRLSRFEEALESYRHAINIFGSVLELAPEDVNAINNTGNIFQLVGEVLAQNGQNQAACESYERAICSFGGALLLAPHHPHYLNNKGYALRSLADAQRRLSLRELALENYEQAVACFDAAIESAPDYVNALHSRGIALQHLGALQASQSLEEAASSYREAVRSYEEALAISPNAVYIAEARDAALDEARKLQQDP